MSVAIFWDYENCALPALEPSYIIVNQIRRLAHQYGSVKTFKAYLEYPEQISQRSMMLRSELQSCGVSLIDCPHNGRKDVADKMMMIDMMAHAIDTPAPSTIVLISGDRDFVYAVSILCLRQYRVVLLAPRAAHSSLKAQANAVYNWPDDFLPALPPAAAAPTAGVAAPRVSTRMRSATLDDLRQHHAPPPMADTHNNHAKIASDGKASDVGHDRLDDDATIVKDSHVAEGPDVATSVSEQEEAMMEGSAGSASAAETSSCTSSEKWSSIEQMQPGEQHDSRSTGPASWATIAQLLQPRDKDRTLSPSSIFRRTSPPPFPSANLNVDHSAISSSNLNAEASLFVPSPATFSRPIDALQEQNDDSEWQTYSRVAKKRPAQVPPEFKPLVKVLKRQLAEGVPHVESSQLGQFLSQEVPKLSIIYERAGVTKLKEYTALAAEQGIIVISKEGADGHNSVTLHYAYRRNKAT